MHLPSFISSAEKLITDNAPTILTAVGVVGTVGTAVLTGKATWTAQRRINVATVAYDNKLTHEGGPMGLSLPVREQLKIALPLYIPAVAAGGATITCIVFANKINAGRLAALAGAYALTDGKLKDYKSKVEELMGVEKKQEVEDAVARDKIAQSPKVVVIGDGSGKGLYYDSYSARPFWATRNELEAARNAVMLQVLNHGYADLNKWFNEIGLEETGYGDNIGWSTHTPLELQIRPSMDSKDERPMAYVDYDTEPIGRYNHQ